MDHTRAGMDIQSSICGLTCLIFLAQKRAATARIARAGNVTERAMGVARFTETHVDGSGFVR